MAQAKLPSPAAQAYASALLALADERNVTPQVAQEMQAVGEVMSQTPHLTQFFSDPKVSQEAKDHLLDRAFGSRFQPLTFNTIRLLSSKDQLALLPEVAQAFEDLLDERLGKVEVDITVAKRLLPPDLEQVRVSLQRSLGKDPVIHQYVDESIIGGIIVKIGDRLIDGSVRAQLDALRNKLLKA